MANSYTKNHFGKTIDEDITAADVINYFAVERQETITLEFKSYNTRDTSIINGVFRTIAAFLNSEGGLLIFGAPLEVRKQDNYKVVQGDPTPIPTNITTKDRLVDSISGNISYMPIGIRVLDVQMPDGGFLYLIEVQESSNKPHQHNKTYPVRLDGQSASAPHYLVEMMFNQIKRPELKGFLRVSAYRIQLNNYDSYNTVHLIFEVTIVNVSKTMSDTDVYLKLISNSGVFNVPTDPNYRFENKGATITVTNISPLITESLKVKRSYGFSINTDQLRELTDQILTIKIVFGGKNSLPRSSIYSIMQKNIRLSPGEVGRDFTREKDLNNLLEIQKQENIPYTDLHQPHEDESVLFELNGI